MEIYPAFFELALWEEGEQIEPFYFIITPFTRVYAYQFSERSEDLADLTAMCQVLDRFSFDPTHSAQS